MSEVRSGPMRVAEVNSETRPTEYNRQTATIAHHPVALRGQAAAWPETMAKISSAEVLAIIQKVRPLASICDR